MNESYAKALNQCHIHNMDKTSTSKLRDHTDNYYISNYYTIVCKC